MDVVCTHDKLTKRPKILVLEAQSFADQCIIRDVFAAIMSGCARFRVLDADMNPIRFDLLNGRIVNK